MEATVRSTVYRYDGGEELEWWLGADCSMLNSFVQRC
jgi:hypothetical protein